MQDINEDLPLLLEDAEIEVIRREKETDDWKTKRYPIPKRDTQAKCQALTLTPKYVLYLFFKYI